MNERSNEADKVEDKPVGDKDNRIPVLLVEAHEPFPELALFRLDAVPRPGDLINIAANGKLQPYNVNFVNFNAFNQRSQITVGCSFSAPTIANEAVQLKERMDQVVRAQTQMFEKAQAYSNAMMLAGYAGIFALWTFSKGSLTTKTTDAIILLVGVSLIFYVSWEIYGMIHRATVAAKFLALVDKAPNEFFQTLAREEVENRRIAGRYMVAWKIIIIPTILSAYVGAAILIYNAAASIFGFTQWP
jgi:hypothetical protein